MPVKSHRIRRILIDLVPTLLIALVLYLGLHIAVEPRIVLGQSMEPTLHNNEYVLLDKFSYWFHGPERGDIVVFHYPLAPSVDYIKRVIGVAGDHVQVDGGNVYVDGARLSERYIAAQPDYTDNRVVPNGYLYVLGDNRDNSSDSHIWGLLPLKDVVGRALIAYWPLSDASFLADPSYPGVH
jgi:signal peptidase I